MDRRQDEDLRQVVHVNQVIQLAGRAAEHWNHGPGRHLENLEEAPVAGPVDGRRTNHRERQIVPGRELANPQFRLSLGPLVDIAGTERIILVRRRILDMAMHAHGGNMDKALESRVLQRGLGQQARALHVNLAVHLVAQPRLPEGGRHVENDIDTRRRPLDHRGIKHIPFHPFDRKVAQAVPVR